MTDIAQIEFAAFRLAGYALRTPMLTSLALNAPPIDLWPPDMTPAQTSPSP